MSALGQSERIVVRAPNWLGDAVMATPGLRALRAHVPKARITLQVGAQLAPLFAGSPFIDEIVAMDDPRPRGLRALGKEARRLRVAGPFDYGLCLPDSPSSALLMRMAGVRRLGGYARSGRGLLLADAVRAPRAWGRRRLVAREIFVLTLLEALGCESLGTELQLHTTDAEEAEAGRLLSGVDEPAASQTGARLVGLAPGASFGPSKQWPEHSFAALADALVARGDRVVFIGSASERAGVERIQASMKHEAVSLAGQTPLGPLKAVLRRLDLLVANDAGARHVAVAFGVPVVVFMGPTSLDKTSENLDRVEVLIHDVACRPCYKRTCPVEGHPCMTGITLGEALAAASRLIRCDEAAAETTGASATHTTARQQGAAR